MPTQLMTDEEFEITCDDRDERLKLSCCICLKDGWDYKDCYAPLRNMVIPNCRHNSHAICIQCIHKIAYEKIETHSLMNEAFLLFTCPYPYSRHSCTGKIKKCVWESLLPKESLLKNSVFIQQHQNDSPYFKQGKRYVVQCSECKTESWVTNNPEEQRWSCSQCLRTSCGRCDETFCYHNQCKSTLSKYLPKGYSRYFSQTLSNGCKVPIRKHLVTTNMKEEMVNNLKKNFPLVHANCPTCKIPLYKTSACNDLKHCGSMHVCNFCFSHSFPWENGMPLEHWKTCTRWDSDFEWFPCKENECFEETRECLQPSHAPFIQKLNYYKMQAFTRNVEKEFKN